MADEPQMITRGKGKEMEKTSTGLISNVIKDILLDPRFQQLIESHVQQALHTLKCDIQAQEARILDLEVTVDNKSKEIAQLKSQVEAQSNLAKRALHQINQQEQYSRRNCLRFFGLPEKANESTDALIIDLSTKILKVPLTTDDLERSHRVGKPDPEKPRPIIAKFKSYRKRREVIVERRKLAGTKKSILEDLTASNATLLNKARSSEHVKSAWSVDGRIFAISHVKGSRKKLITCEEDIAKLLPQKDHD